MRYLILLLVLTACGHGYEVKVYGGNNEKLYICREINPIFIFNMDLRICYNATECNEFCDKKNRENK